MNFKTKKIRKRSPKVPVPKPPKEKREWNFKLNTKDKFWIKLIVIVLVAVPLVSFASGKIFNRDTSITSTLLKTIGSDLQKDSDGFTNILALGIGGEGHEGEELTDTILVGSINEKTNEVLMISLPRDLYVQHDNIISQRINSVFENVKYKQSEEVAFQTISDIAEEITGLEIHYHVKIDFQGLVDVVDAVGGVTIDVEETIYDPYYPNSTYGFQTFSLGKGLQQLDGQTALKYARSRKTTSDFDRANRQQKLIFAIKEKALSLGFLSNPTKITEIYQSVSSNLETNLELREIISLAGVAADIQEGGLNKLVVHNDPIFKGGFLYTPPRSQYQDAFVLLPAGDNYDQVHTFIELHQKYPEVMHSEIPIELLNGTKTSGFAGSTALILGRFGFNVERVANAPTKDIIETTISYTSSTDKDVAEALEILFPGNIEKKADEPHPLDEPETVVYPVTIELGFEAVEIHNQLEVFTTLIPIIEQAEKERIEAREKAQEETDEESENTGEGETETDNNDES